MKHAVLLLFLLFPVVGFSQNLPLNKENQHVEYSGQMDAKGTRSELFTQAKNWIMRTFSSAEEMIELEDQEQGIISIKGSALIDYTPLDADTSQLVPMHFNLKLSAQDNQYHYVFSNIYFKVSQFGMERIIPMEETLLDKAAKRLLLSKEVESSGIAFTSEQFQQELTKAYHQYDRLQANGNGTIVGISGLLKQGIAHSEN